MENIGLGHLCGQFPTTQADSTLRGGLVSVDVGDFLCMDIPAREYILAPWLTSQALAMIHAPRGIGKTHVSLGIAHAVATGKEFLRWTAPKPRGVLFIDGEMSASGLQERYMALVKQTKAVPEPGFLHIVTPDLQAGAMPDLATGTGQDQIDRLVTENTSLIIIDNISTLVRSGKENEAESWQPVQAWALRHRAAGQSVLFVHHSGKGGGQRGTSRREDVLDVVVNLRHPEGYGAKNGAEFELHYEKARGFFGADAASFHARLIPGNGEDPGGWKTQELEPDNFENAVSLLNQGKSQTEVASIMGCHKSTISRFAKTAREEKLLNCLILSEDG